MNPGISRQYLYFLATGTYKASLLFVAVFLPFYFFDRSSAEKKAIPFTGKSDLQVALICKCTGLYELDDNIFYLYSFPVVGIDKKAAVIKAGIRVP